MGSNPTPSAKRRKSAGCSGLFCICTPRISPRNGLLFNEIAFEAVAAFAGNSVLQFSRWQHARRLPWPPALVLSFEYFRPLPGNATGWRRSKGDWQAAQSWVRLLVSFAEACLANPIERSCSIARLALELARCTTGSGRHAPGHNHHGFRPRNGLFTLGVILGGIWRYAAKSRQPAGRSIRWALSQRSSARSR